MHIYKKKQKQTNLRKEAEDTFFSVHCDNGVKHPTDRRKKSLNFRLRDEIKSSLHISKAKT